MALTVLDPTAESEASGRTLLTRTLTSLEGTTVALLDITKPRSDVFLDRVEELLVAEGAAVRRYRKESYTKPAAIDIRQEIARECNAVIEALAD